MKKFILNIFLTILGLISLNSCLLDDHVTDFGKGPIVTQFPSATLSENFLQDENNTVYDYEIPIQYFGDDGTPLDEDVQVEIGVSPDTEAQEGVEFSLADPNVVIPAGENTGAVVVQVISEALDAFDPKQMVLEIVSSNQQVSSNKNKVSVTLQAICPSSLAGEYQYTNEVNGDITITETGSGKYEVSADNAFGEAYPFNISDVCGVLTVTGGYLPDNFGVTTSGYGEVDEETGIITIYYTAEGYFDDRPMVLVPQ